MFLYSYFRLYTVRLFLGCSLLVVRCNFIRALWELHENARRKDWSYRKKYIEEFVWVISLFWLHSLLSLSFCCFLHLILFPFPSDVLADIYTYIYIAMGGILCDDIMSKWYYTLFLQATLFFYSASVLLRFFMNWSSNVA